MPLNIHDELHSLLDALHRKRVSYALCGGLAVAVYGIVRATEDIDLLVEEASLGKVRAVAEGLGFRFDPKPLDLKRGRIRIYRLFRPQEGTCLNWISCSSRARPKPPGAAGGRCEQIWGPRRWFRRAV